MSITACPKCGSKKIFQGRLKEGVLTGYTYRYVCRDCGYQGFPIIFDSNVEYYKFLMRKKSDKQVDKISKDERLDEDNKLSGKDKEVVNFLNELDTNSSPVIEARSTTFKIFISLSIVLIFSLIITLYYTPVYFFLPAILVVVALEFIFYIIYRNKVN